MRRRRTTIVASLLILVLLALLLLQAHSHKSEQEPTPLDKQARWLLYQIIPGGVASRTEVAEIVVPALNAYYRDLAEYPPYMFGGPPTIRHTFEHTEESSGQVPNPDPLMTGGYLDEYPLVWCDTMWVLVNLWYVATDPRGYAHWKCMFSTPGDLRILSPESRMIVSGGFENLFGNAAVPDSDCLALEMGKYGDRYYALGIETAEAGYPQFSVWPPGQTGYANADVENAMEYIRGDMPYFGYQRGEWLGDDSNSCWLWFYGYTSWADKYKTLPSNIKQAKKLLLDREFATEHGQDDTLIANFCWDTIELEPKGLDLLDAGRGLLKPDGVPDYICLLYKLKDGAVVEVVRADDM